MNFNKAIELSKYLKLNFEVFVSTKNFYISYALLHEIISDKLQWALNNKLQLKNAKEFSVFNSNGEWENPVYPNLEACLYSYDIDKNDWTWNRITGNGDLEDFFRYLKECGVYSSYSLLPFCISVFPFFEYNISSWTVKSSQ